ncbi:hypothetical protein ACFQ1S_09725, partial [Kibdelosporangium lantanae]
ALGAGPFTVGVLTALQWVPFLLFGSLAGVWVDRWRRKPVMTWTNLLRFVLMALIPLAYAADVLALWQLYVIATAVGVLTVFFQVAFRAFLAGIDGLLMQGLIDDDPPSVNELQPVVAYLMRGRAGRGPDR